MSEMKLWVLRPALDLPDKDNPWEPWYDKTFGFVIRAGSAQEARAIAHKNAKDENRGEFMGRKTSNTTTPWIDPNYSTCCELRGGKRPGVVMEDYASA